MLEMVLNALGPLMRNAVALVVVMLCKIRGAAPIRAREEVLAMEASS